MPQPVDAFLPQDGNGQGISIGAPEIEKARGLCLHVRQTPLFQFLPENSLCHET
jgi:hypothetical protein